jgi:hypothetical protein
MPDREEHEGLRVNCCQTGFLSLNGASGFQISQRRSSLLHPSRPPSVSPSKRIPHQFPEGLLIVYDQFPWSIMTVRRALVGG